MAEPGRSHGVTGDGVQTFGIGKRSSYLPRRLALFGNSRRENTCGCSPHDAAAAQPRVITYRPPRAIWEAKVVVQAVEPTEEELLHYSSCS